MNREEVVSTHFNAICKGSNREGYQIVANQPLARLLSAKHVTEDEAWEQAAKRVRVEQEARNSVERNKEAVLKKFPDAYCCSRGGRCQIRRLRTPHDKPSPISYVSLSGHYTLPEFAWQEAANRLLGISL